MKDQSRRNQELLKENDLLKQKIQELEQSESEYKLAEEALRNSEAFINRIIDESPNPIWISDQNGTMIRINQACCNLLNITAGEVIGKYNVLNDNIVEEQGLLPLVKSVFEEGKTVRFDITYKTPLLKQIKLQREAFVVLDVTIFPIIETSGKITNAVIQHIDITERKRAEEASRNSEARYRTLFEQSPNGILLIDTETGRTIEANETASKQLGYTREEFAALRVSDYEVLESPEETAKHIQKVLRDGIDDFETLHRTKSGEIRNVHVWTKKTQLRDHSHIFAIFQDITERKEAEEALRESEKKYRLIAENTADQISVFDMNLHFTYVSPAIMSLRGYTVEEAMEQTLDQVLTPESLRAGLILFEKEMQLEASGTADPDRTNILELEEYKKDGSIIWVEASFSFLRDKDRNPVGILVVSRDITDRKRAEEALKESEERFRRLADSTFEGIIIHDKGEIFDMNQSILEMTGYERDDVIGKNMMAFIAPEFREIALLRSQAEYNDPYEAALLRKDGTIIHVEVAGKPIQYQGRNARVVTIHDITNSKRAEEEKRSLEERLQRAEKMESLGILAGGVAHDLNNVLGIVVGYAEMLLMGADKSSPIRSKLVNIMEGGQKAATIVGDLLTLARRGVSGRDVLNLNSIISDCQKSSEFKQLSSFHSSIQIKTELEHGLLNISGSSVHLGKTIFNLVSNASEAMSKGGVMTIKTANRYLDKPIQGYDEIREGDYVVFSISDTGEGIHEADLKRIFEPFYTKKVMGRSGTGLGLAVVWGTVKDHNGYITVQSEEGKGSTFTLYFPVTREELSSDHVAISLSEYTGKGESILIVDDVKGQRDLAEEMLRKLNYNVTSVSSGEEAVTYLKEHEADLMVLDMIMDPGMDGLDTYRSILEIRPELKAIIVSGFSESDRVKVAQSLGAGAYVRKPYVIEKLGLAVKRELDRST